MILTVFVGIIAFSNLALLIGLIVAIRALQKVIREDIAPTMTEVANLTRGINDIVESIKTGVDNMINTSEETIADISGKVRKTSDLFHKTVSEPLIALSSLIAGISKAIETFRHPTQKD